MRKVQEHRLKPSPEVRRRLTSTFDIRAAFSACSSSADVDLLLSFLSFSDLFEFSPRTKPRSGRGKMKSVFAPSYNSNI